MRKIFLAPDKKRQIKEEVIFILLSQVLTHLLYLWVIDKQKQLHCDHNICKGGR